MVQMQYADELWVIIGQETQIYTCPIVATKELRSQADSASPTQE